MSIMPHVTGIGSYSPGEPLPFERILDVLGHLTEAPPKVQRWVERMAPMMQQALGMENYHYAMDPVTREATEDNITMSVKAARPALAQAGIEPAEVDLLIWAGPNVEHMVPPTSVMVQEALGIPRCAEMAIHSNCTALYKAFQVACDAVRLGRYRNALVVSSNLVSPALRKECYNQAVVSTDQAVLRWFLCDGAGALVIQPDPVPGRPAIRVRDTYLESTGLGRGPDMHAIFGGKRYDLRAGWEHGWHHLTQNFSIIGKVGPEFFRECVENMRKATGVSLDQVDTFFFNIPTKHLMDACIADLREIYHAPNLQFYTKLAKRGYCGPPAIVQALDEFGREHGFKPGQRLASVVNEASKWMHAGFILEIA